MDGAIKRGGAAGRQTRGVRAASLSAALLGGTALLAPAAHAQDNDGLYWAERKRTITVTATRTPTEAVNVPATVTVMTSQDIADRMVTDIKDLVRFEPGVSVPRAPTRFGAALGATGRAGNEGFVIRGIGGNRTQILVDGIRVPDGFSFGAQASGRGDYVDLGLVKRVEILRGPASAFYGSDGLAGVVAFTLSDPEDFLLGDAEVSGLLRAGYNSDDEEFAETAVLAGRAGNLSAMLAYTRRDFVELANAGTVGGVGPQRTEPNPQDGASNAVLGRIVWRPAAGHTISLTGEHTDTALATNVLSGITGTVFALEGRDTGQRTRFAGDWVWEPGGAIDHFQLGAYWQDAEDRQFTFEDREPLADRTRLNTFENRVYGASAELRGRFATGAIEHRLVLGGDVSFTRQQGLRDGTVPPFGEVFPTRAFPVTDFTLGGVFIGDEIEIASGRLMLFPALRFDGYRLDAKDDPLLPTFAGADQSDSHVSPKLGAVVKLAEGLRLYANYATGFKAPEPGQMNQFFENLAFGYTSLPNPDLGPETSDSWEGGVRFASGGFSASATAFRAEYDDFISQEVVAGSFTPQDPAQFQFVNIGKVEVEGLEGKFEYETRGGFAARLAVAYADGGEVLADGTTVPLATIDPLSLVAGVGYRDPGGRFGIEAIVTHNARKSQADTASVCATECFRPDSFTILDLTTFVRATERLTFRAGLFNAFDETYAYWSDVRGLAADSPVIDAYTRPGRNAAISASFRF